MFDPLSGFAILAGVQASEMITGLVQDCLYDVLKFGAREGAATVRMRLEEMRETGEFPTNHTIERGLRRAAIRSAHGVLGPIKPDDFGAYLSARDRGLPNDRDLYQVGRKSLQRVRAGLEDLCNLYRHDGWNEERRQKRLRYKLVELAPDLERVGGDRRDLDAMVPTGIGAPETSAGSAIGELMLSVLVHMSGLEYEQGELLRSALHRRFAGVDAEFPRHLRLFFAEELKVDPELQAILVHQRLSWVFADVQAIKSNQEECRRHAVEQSDEIKRQMLVSDDKLDVILRQQARMSKHLTDILSGNWLLDSRTRAQITDMFREPENAVPRLTDSELSARQFHFSSSADEFVGRRDQMRRIERDFLSYRKPLTSETDAFRWMVISGEAGTGKSRLAQEIIRRNRADFRLAGFASDYLVNAPRFGRERQDHLKDPILIVVDYTTGHQERLPRFMAEWAGFARHSLADGGPPVRIILLMRRPDDRVLDDIRSLSGDAADRLVPDGEVFGGADRIELERLGREDTIELMRARIRNTAEREDRDPIDTSNGDELIARLNRFDRAQRPLFAIMVAHAMQRGILPGEKAGDGEESARMELFSSYLKGQWISYWREQAVCRDTTPAARDGIIAPHANLMRMMTACGGASRRSVLAQLKRLHAGDEEISERLPSHRIRDEFGFQDRLAVSIAGGRGKMNDGIVDPLPTLEPDLIGECFVLMTSSGFGVDGPLWCTPKEVIDFAWRLSPEHTAKFIRLMAQDYPQRMRDFRWFPPPDEEL
jgi:hypothetical protein